MKSKTNLLLNIHPNDCPAWEYRDWPNSHEVIAAIWKQILVGLRKKTLSALDILVDSRDMHKNLFHELTNEEHGYFAGHYRGEPFRCLRCYKVFVRSDPRVGTEPAEVKKEMGEFERIVRSVFSAIDAGAKSIVSNKQKIVYAVKAVCKLFVTFLQIHPYANGNGHVARIFIWALLSKFDIWPTKMPVEPGPTNYGRHITAYRNGNTQPLEMFVLRCI